MQSKIWQQLCQILTDLWNGDTFKIDRKGIAYSAMSTRDRKDLFQFSHFFYKSQHWQDLVWDWNWHTIFGTNFAIVLINCNKLRFDRLITKFPRAVFLYLGWGERRKNGGKIWERAGVEMKRENYGKWMHNCSIAECVCYPYDLSGSLILVPVSLWLN